MKSEERPFCGYAPERQTSSAHHQKARRLERPLELLFDAAPVAQPRSAAPEVRKAAELDQGVIDSLLGGSGSSHDKIDGKTGDKNAPGKSGGNNPGNENTGGQA
jgi:hypothetical protein